MHRHIVSHPFGLLVTQSNSGLCANHLPFELVLGDGPYGTLRGHVAIANPVWRERRSEEDALIVFGGPDAYISPSWYATRSETAKVVPTWNYVAIHAAGPLQFFDDMDRLRLHLDQLTETFERGRAKPWSLAEAPEEYIDQQMKKIVPFEMKIRELSGKWKLSQNRSLRDREGVITGLANEGSSQAMDVGRYVENALRTPPEDDAAS